MARKRLTIRTVEALPTGATVWDTEVRGFGVRRQRRDTVYVLKYRYKGRQRFFTIGLHGAPWTVEKARTEAKRLLGMVADKIDPAANRDAAKAQPTLSELADRYLAEYAGAHKKPRTVEEDKRNIELHLKPALGLMKVGDIDRPDVARMHAKRRHRPVNANRCLATLWHMLSWAEKQGLRPDGSNPCRHIDRYPEKPRERLITAEEVARLGDALAAASVAASGEPLAPPTDRVERERSPIRRQRDGKGRYKEVPEDWRAIACIRLLTTTGARLSEILTLQWDWIDWERGVARLPDSKTGAKNLPLAAPALALLKELPRMKGNPYVLPGDGKHEHFVGVQKPWQRIRKAAGLSDVRLHDLRHAFASFAVASGDSLYLVGKVLGHRQASTTERYAHLAPDPVRAVADRTAERIAAMLNASTAGADVVPLRGKPA